MKQDGALKSSAALSLFFFFKFQWNSFQLQKYHMGINKDRNVER